MTRYRGVVGTKLPPEEVSPGVWESKIVETDVVGDIYLKPSRWSGTELSQTKITANHILSIFGCDNLDDYADVVYVVWQNRKWTVTKIEYIRPRVKLTLGGLYDG